MERDSQLSKRERGERVDIEGEKAGNESGGREIVDSEREWGEREMVIQEKGGERNCKGWA